MILDDKNRKIHTSYIGDSLYMILRNINGKYEKNYKSTEQVHGFNTPYQVGTRGDNPELALLETHDIMHNDILILATDG